MSFSMNGLLRGFIYLTIATSLTAVGVGRLAPRETHFRLLKPVNMVPVNGYHFRTYDRVPRIFDPETGSLQASARFECGGGDSFEGASCSPWEDDLGRSDVIGRWLGRSSADGVCEGCGLARFRWPGGELVERVKLTVMPVSRPCFDPKRPTSVVYAAGDGRLYRHTFADDSGFGAAEDGVVAPTPLAWNTATAGEQPVAINDPVWPTDPRFKGRLIASFTYLRRVPGGSTTMENRLGWFELDRDGGSIVRSGPLVDGAPDFRGGEPYFDETMPVVAAAPDGAGLMVAYLTHVEGEPGWTLRLAPLKFAGAEGAPRVEGAQVQVVARERSHAVPIFSADRRRIYSIVNSDPKPDAMDSFRVPEPLSQPLVSPAEPADGVLAATH